MGGAEGEDQPLLLEQCDESFITLSLLMGFQNFVLFSTRALPITVPKCQSDRRDTPFNLMIFHLVYTFLAQFIYFFSLVYLART
jgi:hypothetical protein